MYESKIRICKTFLIFIFISQTKTWQKIVFRKSLTLKDWIFVKQQTNPKKPKSKFLAKLNLCNFVHLPWEHTFLAIILSSFHLGRYIYIMYVHVT